MRKTPILASSAFLAFSLVAAVATAREYNMDNLPYSDAPSDRETAVAISVLSDENVLRGDPGGTIRPNAKLNRAEFMTIVMRLLPETDFTGNLNCFPDVRASDWYAEDVCRAKAAGIVEGNRVEGTAASTWKFEPTRNIQYEEAVKVLVKMYALPIVDTGESAWYVPYIETAAKYDLDIQGLVAGDTISRGEMARLAVNFLAYAEGELDLLKAAQSGASSSHSSSRMSSSRSSGSSVSSRSMSSGSSRSSGSADSMTDTQAKSQVVLLGETSPIIGGVRFFSNNEPIIVSSVMVNLTAEAPSISSFLVYDGDRRLLGTASRNTATQYRLNLTSDTFVLPRREDVHLYVRAQLKEDEDGGASGQEFQISTIQVTGDGEWSNEDYTETSTGTYPAFETARAILTNITHAGDFDSTLFAGSDVLLGEFRFESKKGDTQADPRITALRFQVEGAGGATVSDPYLRVQDSDVSHSCSVASSVVTCANIPTSIGSIEDGSTIIRLYADVAVTDSNATLRLSLNAPGSISSAGDITWTDGENTFTWVPFSQPVARGTQFD
jgi:hypothetical protein